jgi:hypothetical protein
MDAEVSTRVFNDWLATAFDSEPSDGQEAIAGAQAPAAQWHGAENAAAAGSARQPSQPLVDMQGPGQAAGFANNVDGDGGAVSARGARAGAGKGAKRAGSGGRRAPKGETAQQRAHRLFYERKKEQVGPITHP